MSDSQSNTTVLNSGDFTVQSATIDVLAAQIVSSYVVNHQVQKADLPGLINLVRNTLEGTPPVGGSVSVEKHTPDEIKASITHDALISFEDGKSYKTLRRHLKTRDLTPESYRAKHGLPSDYPMTSAGYSEQRSELARSFGLGQNRRAAQAAEPAPKPPASGKKRPTKTAV